jgi:hypothetical protein
MKRHPTTHKNLAPTQKSFSLTPGDLEDPEKMILIAQNHFATSFPNERRADCPARYLLRAARDGQPPSDELRSHLFRCSECFKEFRAAALDYYQLSGSAEAPRSWITKLMDLMSRFRQPLFACAAVALLITAGIFIQRLLKKDSLQLKQNRSQPAPMASTDLPSAPGPPAPPSEAPSDPELLKPRPAETFAINLDLNRYKALGDSTRGGSLHEEKKTIKMPPRRALLKLRLRKGSEAGLYWISVVDANSKPLIGTSARSLDGKSLNAVLDLRRAARKGHRLRVVRGDDLNEYLIEIAKP